MRMLILWAVIFGSVVCGGATGVCGDAELLPERPEGAVESDADIGAYPRPDAGYVTDLADMLSRDEEERIEQLLWRAEAEKGVEIAVVTIDSLKEYPGTANDAIESFAREMFNRYRIGNLPKTTACSCSCQSGTTRCGSNWARAGDGATMPTRPRSSPATSGHNLRQSGTAPASRPA